jgi:hypothetical protein
MGKWNVVSEDSEPSIILSEVNKKVHCADNIVQQTCKSWQDVTFKLQKALCRWEHAKSTFLSHNGHHFKSLNKREPLNQEEKRSNAYTQQKQEHLFAFLSSENIHCVYTLLLKKHLLCKLNLFKL